MYCKKCGAVIPEGRSFCSKCGSKISGDTIENVMEEQNGGMARTWNKKRYLILSIGLVILIILIIGSFLSIWRTNIQNKDAEVGSNNIEDVHWDNEMINRVNNFTVNGSDSAEEEISDETEITMTNEMPVVSYMYCGDYSEGLVWIKYNVNDCTYWSCMDKDGLVQFVFEENEIQSVLPFQKGYAQVSGNGEYHVIDMEGNILSSYVTDADCKMCAYGDGYTVMEQYVADFYSSKYVYTIYDYSGQAIEICERDKSVSPVYYCGQGVFGFQMEANNGNATDFYCIKSGEWVHMYSSQPVYFYDEDIAIWGVGYYSPETNEGNRSDILFMDPDGKLYHFPLSQDWGWDWISPYVKDGMCILNEIRGNCLLSYDIHSDEIVELDSSYADILKADRLAEPLVFYNGVVAIPLKGADNHSYISIFDTKWNIIMEPVLMGTYELSDERLVVNVDNNTYVYNSLTGDKVFNLDELGFIKMGSYSDGAAYVTADPEIYSVDPYVRKQPLYIDINGNLLFQEVNFSEFLVDNED